MIETGVLSSYSADNLRLYKRTADTFIEKGYNDDRRLFVNTYRMLADLASEQPNTEAGKRAIRKYATDLAGELDTLRASLATRGMLR